MTNRKVAVAGFEPYFSGHWRMSRGMWDILLGGKGQQQLTKLECPKDSHVRNCSATERAMRLPLGRLYDVTVSLDTSVSN